LLAFVIVNAGFQQMERGNTIFACFHKRKLHNTTPLAGTTPTISSLFLPLAAVKTITI